MKNSSLWWDSLGYREHFDMVSRAYVARMIYKIRFCDVCCGALEV